jgi:hypothetical protein
MRHPVLIALALALASTAADAQSACFDLSKSEPHALTGMLSHRIFPGPPNFNDVQNGDRPEPGYLLTLAKPICLTGDEFADSSNLFSEVQLVATDKTGKALRALLNSNVDVTLSRPMAAQTGHHHRPLVAWVVAISAASRH